MKTVENDDHQVHWRSYLSKVKNKDATLFYSFETHPLEMITVFHERVSRPSLGRFLNFGGCVL